MISASDFRKGITFEINGAPHVVLDFQHVKPGKGAAFVRTKYKNILTGAMMVEIVFSWKGMGTLIYDSVTTKDFPMLQGCFLFIGVCVVVFNFLADLICTMIDPRIKGGAGREV